MNWRSIGRRLDIVRDPDKFDPSRAKVARRTAGLGLLVAGGIVVSGSILGGVVISGTPTPTGCDVNATTANFAAQLAATTAGQTLCLASGAYGDFAGVNRSSPGITIKEQSGATATFNDLTFAGGPGPTIGWFTLDGIDYSGGDVCAPAHDITVKNATQTGQLQINAGAGPGANNTCTSAPQMTASSNLVWDGMTFTLSDCPTGSCLGPEGRVSFAYGSTVGAGITIRNSVFTGSCADGVQFYGNQDSGRGVTITDNEFVNLLQGSCAPHVDSIQFVGGSNVTITRNWFHNSTHGVVDYDGHADGTVVTNNVFGPSLPSDSVCLGGAANPVIEHNTFLDGIMTLCVNHDSTPTTNVVWRNNIQNGNPNVQGASTYASGLPNYDLCTTGTCAGANSLNGSPTFAGGATPSTWAGYALAAGSLGKAAASDGTDIGINP